jgi:hypothetical protein
MTALEDARAALAGLDDPNHGRDWSGWDYVLYLEKPLRALADEYERVTTPPTEDEREVLRRILFDDRTFRTTEQIVDGILAAGFRRPGPVTDAEVEAALRAWMNADTPSSEDAMRAALDAARGV